MAKNQGKIYLGYEDETISEKHQILQNYTTNKIGGYPDWPPLENLQFSFKCPLCGLNRLLVVQCYVPLANSVYHRTLYVFACINPNCWMQSESWLCVRSQFQENSDTVSSTTVAIPSPNTNLSWCNAADEWGDNDTASGNFMNVDNAPSPNNVMQRNSDEDEDSNSIELETVEQALGNLQVYDAHNANMVPLQGAVGAIGAPVATAELEDGDEAGLVTADAAATPADDVAALLHQTAELPSECRSLLMSGQLQFVSKYMYVEQESKARADYDDKVAELLNKYKKCNEIEVCVGDGAGAPPHEPREPYEPAAPLHGDRLFHAFLTRLRGSPGQILRYSRDEPPVLGAPLPVAPPAACARCGSRLLCELQLVPQFAESLRLPPTTRLAHLHFLSVLVFTCSQSCWRPRDTLVEELVVFQPEVV